MRGEDVRQAPVDLGRLVRAAPDEGDVDGHLVPVVVAFVVEAVNGRAQASGSR